MKKYGCGSTRIFIGLLFALEAVGRQNKKEKAQ